MNNLDMSKCPAGIIYTGPEPETIGPASRDDIIVFDEKDPLNTWEIMPFKRYLANGGNMKNIRYRVKMTLTETGFKVHLSNRSPITNN